jgi:hypothetical protein
MEEARSRRGWRFSADASGRATVVCAVHPCARDAKEIGVDGSVTEGGPTAYVCVGGCAPRRPGLASDAGARSGAVGARRRVGTRSGMKTVRGSPVRPSLCLKNSTKVLQEVYTKVVDLTTSTTSTKAHRGFAQWILHKLLAKLELCSLLMNSAWRRRPRFYTTFHLKFEMPLNMKVVSHDKLHNFFVGRI